MENLYQKLKDFGKNVIIIGGLAGILSFGCEHRSPAQSAEEINKILNSPNKKAQLHTNVEFRGLSNDIIKGTKIYLEVDSNKTLFLKTKDLVTSIETGDLNNDSVDDFIVSYRIYGRLRYDIVKGTRSETYLSINKSFNYE